MNAVVGVIRGHGENTRYFIDGHEVTKEAFDEALPDAPKGGGRAGDSLTGWKPIVSDALAVHPRQVREAVEDAKAKGVPTEFQPDGRPVLTSRTHRAKYLKAYGFFDKDAGYGDPADGSFKGKQDGQQKANSKDDY